MHADGLHRGQMTGASVAAWLLPPALPSVVLPRPRLSDRLDAVRERRLATVVADPGYGKTVLLASWATRSTVWYSATSADRSPLGFARGLLAALRLRLPGLPASVAGATTLALGPYVRTDRDTQADAVAEVLAAEVAAHICGGLVLVVDDAHELAADPPTLRVLEGLCRHAPRDLHLVLASRHDLGFAVDRLRTAGELVELTGHDLAFAPAETAELVALLLDPDPDLAGALHRVTSGWAAALRLAIEALAMTPLSRRRTMLERLGSRTRGTFDALVDDVLEQAPSGLAELVNRVAPYDRFNIGLAQALGCSDVAKIIGAAERSGTIITADTDDPDWWVLPPLVRDRALARTAGDPTNLSETDGADWLLAHGHLVGALQAYARAADHSSVADLLITDGSALVAAGYADLVVHAAAGVPVDLRSEALDLLEGEARQVGGDNDGALACFRRLVPDAGPVPAAVAWRVGLAQHLRGELADAFDVYERGLGGSGSARDRALVRAWLAAAVWRQGNEVRCRELGGQALALAAEAEDDHAAAVAHTALAMADALAGDRRANELHYVRALEHAERIGDLLQVARIRTNRASRSLEEGAYGDALTELEVALQSAELSGSSNFRALSLLNRAEALLGLGRLDEAERDAEASRDEYQRAGSRTVSYALAVLGEVHRERGDLMLARSAYEEAIVTAEPNLDLQGLVPGLAGLARTLDEQGVDGGEALARRAVELGMGMHHQGALLTAGWLALARGDRAEAARLADAVGELSRRRRDRSAAAGALLLAASAATGGRAVEDAEEAGEIWRQLGNPLGVAKAELVLAQLGVHDAAAHAASAMTIARRVGARRLAAAAERVVNDGPSRHPLVIRSLGGFQVVLDGVRLDGGAWGSRKPRDLLKILVARQGRPVTRDALVELLWPGEDPARGPSRLSVVLSTLRAVLDPARSRNADWVVGADRAVVWLRRDRVHVDVAEFLAASERGLAALRLGANEPARVALTAAEALYAGDFLEEHAFEDWAAGLREEARNAYVTVVHALAALTAEVGDPDAASAYLFRLLVRDPYDERAHLGLVAALERSGRRGDARRAYRTYSARMDEIDVEPQPFPAT